MSLPLLNEIAIRRTNVPPHHLKVPESEFIRWTIEYHMRNSSTPDPNPILTAMHAIWTGKAIDHPYKCNRLQMISSMTDPKLEILLII